MSAPIALISDEWKTLVILIGVDDVESVAIIAHISYHLPIGASLGRILAVSMAAIITDDATWGFDVDARQTWRLVYTRAGLCERTLFKDGVELSRSIIPA